MDPELPQQLPEPQETSQSQGPPSSTVPIDTYTAQVVPGKVSIDTQEGRRNYPVDPEVAKIRAFKAAYGIKDVNPRPEEDIYKSMVSGYEGVMRDQVALEVDRKKSEKDYNDMLKLSKAPETTPDMLEKAILNLDTVNKTNPDTVFEEAFAKAMTNRTYQAIIENYKPNTAQSLADAFRNVEPGTSQLITNQQYLLRWAQDINTQTVGAQSWPGYIADLGKNLFQPYLEIKQRGNVPNVSFFQGPLGYNLRQQGTEVLRLPTQKMIETLKPVIEGLKRDNPQLAVQYLSSLARMTGEEEVLNNLQTFMMPLDYASLAAVKGFKQGIRTNTVDLLSGKITKESTSFAPRPKAPTGPTSAWDEHIRAVNAAKDLVKAGTEEPLTPATISAAVGDNVGAGVKKASEIVESRLKGNTTPTEEIRQGADLLTSNYRIDREDISNNVGSRGSDQANRVLQAYDRHETAVVKAITERTLVDQLPGVFKSEAALKALADRVREQGIFKGLASSVGDVHFVRDPVSNTYEYKVILRQAGGMSFHHEGDALGWAQLNRLPMKDLEVVPEGSMGFRLELRAPLKLSDPILQDLLIPTAHEAAPVGQFRAWFGWALNPDETLSAANRENRKIAAYGPSWLMQAVGPDAKIMQSFARGATRVNPLTGAVEERQLKGMRQRWNDMDRMIKALRTAPNKDDPAAPPGIWHRSVGELEDYYTTHYSRLPNDAETQYYFAYKRINEYDRVLRDLRYYSNMWNEGVRQHKFEYLNKDGSKATLNFRATEIDHLPRTEGSMLYIRDNTAKGGKLYDASRLGPTVNKEIEKGLEEGTHKIYRVWNPDEHEFAFYGPVKSDDHWVRYVVIKGGAESSNIPFNLLPRRGGGHWDVDHPFYLAQPRIYFDKFTEKASGERTTRAIYAGPRTIMPIQIRAQGETIAKHLNAIRELFKNREADAAEAYHIANAKEIGVPFDRITAWFQPTKDAEGRMLRPMLDLDHSISVRPKDVDLIDMDKSIQRHYESKGIEFLDGTKRGNPARQAQVQYTGMRDADEVWTVKDHGTRYNPLYEYEPASFVDPTEAMNRALTKITQSTYMEDYKKFGVSHWLKRASNFLEEDDNLLATSPYHHFYDPKWKKGVPEDTKRLLMAENMNIRQFLGMSNPTDKMIKESTQKLIDNIYGKYGPNAVKLIPDWMLFGINDPIQFVKSMTYQAALGLFSIPQLFVQLNSLPLIAALSPRAAGAANFAAMLHQWSRINPKMVDALDNWATKLQLPGSHSFKPGEFKELRELGLRTGFFDIQGEHAVIDDLMRGNKLVKSLGREFLDWGAMPFKGGERQVRFTAFYAAGKEFRELHPTGRLTRADEAWILNRADDLYGNMSRASSSQLHTGILSIPTQFLSYQIRVAELFLGSRTTAADKARMFATFSALYGVPMAAGLTGLPLGDYLKRKAMEEGYVVGDNYITTMITEGLPSVFLALATGGGDIKKGTFYNFGERYGVNGMDLFRGDKGMWDVVGGAAYSKAKGALTAMSPFWQTMMSAFRDDDQAFPIKPTDFLQPLREISSLNNVWGTLATLETGRIFSKKGVYLDDASPLSAIFMGATGLRTTRASNANLMSITLKDREEYKDAQIREFENEFKKGLRISEKQPEEARDFFKRAFVRLWLSGVREDELTKVLSKASNDNESLVDRVDWQYYVTRSPSYAQSSMYDAFSNKLNTIRK